MTKGQKIRLMSDKELTEFLVKDVGAGGFIYARCKICTYNNGCGMTESECREGVLKGLIKDDIE